MTSDEIEKVWGEQSVPSPDAESIESLISRRNAASRRQLNWSLAIAIAVAALGVFNFCGQYFGNGDAMLVSILRALPVFSATVIHWFVIRNLAKQQKEFESLASSQKTWLTQRIESLEQETSGSGWWKLAAFFLFLIVVTALTKVIDFRTGEDSMMEGIAIVAVLIFALLIISAGIWHHRNQFLIPELEGYQKALRDLQA